MGDEVVVRRRRIPGSRRFRFSAYVPSRTGGEHCSVIPDKTKGWLGRIGSEKLPSHVAALPGFTDKRRDEVKSFHARVYRKAYKAILDQRPDLVDCPRCDGEIFADG